jgi:dTDP-4-dehydrorhamnose reductase
MKILLTGKNGQLGFELRRSLAGLGDLISMGRDDCNLSNATELRSFIQTHQPDIIVNAAAYTHVDRAEHEPQFAHALNEVAPSILAEEAARLNALLVHFSTDYVFDGAKKDAYTESDPTNPINRYGISKLAGERAVQTHCTRHLILRTSWVFGAHGTNFAKTILRLAAERDELHIVADQWGSPTYAPLLAHITAHLLRQFCHDPETFPYGLYHAAASGVTTWHAYASYIIEQVHRLGRPMRVAPHAIHAVTSSEYPASARRPAHSPLNSHKLSQTFNLHLPHWHIGVDHFLEQFIGDHR